MMFLLYKRERDSPPQWEGLSRRNRIKQASVQLSAFSGQPAKGEFGGQYNKGKK